MQSKGHTASWQGTLAEGRSSGSSKGGLKGRSVACLPALHSTAHSTAQRSIPQRSAQHSTAQHSTAQHSTEAGGPPSLCSHCMQPTCRQPTSAAIAGNALERHKRVCAAVQHHGYALAAGAGAAATAAAAAGCCRGLCLRLLLHSLRDAHRRLYCLLLVQRVLQLPEGLQQQSMPLLEGRGAPAAAPNLSPTFIVSETEDTPNPRLKARLSTLDDSRRC